jgi:hypothetical protein
VIPKRARPFVVITVVLCALLALGVTTAIAAEPGPRTATVFRACLKNGVLSRVSTTTAPTCPSGFRSVSWSQKGPKGPTGATGPKGAMGATGPIGPSNSFYATDSRAQQIALTLSPILSINLGIGTYVVNADVWLHNDSPSNSSDLAVCELTLGGGASDKVEVGLLGPSGAPLNDGTLSMTVAATIASPTAATVSCAGEGNTGLTYANTVNITAIQSSGLS